MENVITVDCNYVASEVAASFLLPGGDESVIIETNTGYAKEKILEAVLGSNLKPEDIRYIIVTHIHLDHASGSGHLMEIFPRAELICHPRAHRHLHDPERLIRSAKMVYGEERFSRLYGEIRPVPENRIRSVEDRFELKTSFRTFTFYHTEGHAKHHICIHDSLSGGVFTGDAFGLAYPRLQRKGLMIYPATTAIDFDPDEARKSIELIVSLKPERLYLTHFGEIRDIEPARKMLLEGLDVSESIMNRALNSEMSDDEIKRFCHDELKKFIEENLTRLGLSLDAQDRINLDMDTEINAGGIAHAALRRRKKERIQK